MREFSVIRVQTLWKKYFVHPCLKFSLIIAVLTKVAVGAFLDHFFILFL